MNKVIAIDFDGTCVTHEYPAIGKDVPYCESVLKMLVQNDVQIICHSKYCANRRHCLTYNSNRTHCCQMQLRTR